jgi:Protein of unknown function (DUF669)
MPAFDFNRKDGESPQPVPAGNYEVMICRSDFKLTRSGGEQLILGVKIISGAYTGRQIFHAINVAGSDAACAFGRKKLAKLLEALNLEKIEETEELHDRPLMAVVEIEHSLDYDPKNVVNGWHRLEDNGEASRAASAAPAAAKDQAKRRFQQSMKSNSGAAPAASDRRTTAQIIDDNIPF